MNTFPHSPEVQMMTRTSKLLDTKVSKYETAIQQWKVHLFEEYDHENVFHWSENQAFEFIFSIKN